MHSPPSKGAKCYRVRGRRMECSILLYVFVYYSVFLITNGHALCTERGNMDKGGRQ